MEDLRGLDKELYEKHQAKYDPVIENEAKEWIEELSGLKFEGSSFQDSLKDGIILCTLMNKILEVKGEKLIKISKMKQPFKQMENIGNFLAKMSFLGVPAHSMFQTVDLYEGKNVIQVTQSIFALSRNVHQFGFRLLGPKLAEKNERKFTEDQINQSKAAVPLLSGFVSKNSSGITMGGVRQVYDPNLGVGDTTAVTKLMGGLQIEKGIANLGVSMGASRQIGGVYLSDEEKSKMLAEQELKENHPDLEKEKLIEEEILKRHEEIYENDLKREEMNLMRAEELREEEVEKLKIQFELDSLKLMEAEKSSKLDEGMESEEEDDTEEVVVIDEYDDDENTMHQAVTTGKEIETTDDLMAKLDSMIKEI
ncbi:hypothetical protein HK099_004826 [Clydaea vesicula]|uniref:Calponin-homology (CH) domain-containing protein n=1 Tax=Clydaea vesicula TaxID=447962 RepID=A0AAD5XZC7_9FUNG|nr:hypothetical protein HK099_004826 [Clydaea vesicula]